MREGFGPPTETVPVEDLLLLRGYFDAQSRVCLVVWVSHDEPGNDGLEPDHHTVLGVADRSFEERDAEALLRGVEHEVRLPGWVDLFPLSDVETLRTVGTILWEPGAPRIGQLDPLDFHYTWDPVESTEEQRASFAAFLRTIPGVICVEGTYQRLWKADELVDLTMQLFIDFDAGRGGIEDAVRRVETAWEESGLARTPNRGCSLGLPGDPRIKTAVLYE